MPFSSPLGTPEPAFPSTSGVSPKLPLPDSNKSVITDSRESALTSGYELRLIAAREALASPDSFLREAGTQMLMGLPLMGLSLPENSPPPLPTTATVSTTATEPLALLMTAGMDREARVRNGALRVLTQAVASGSLAAETVLLRLLIRNPALLLSLRDAQADQLGQLSKDGFAARRLRFLTRYPDLVKARLRSIETGQISRIQPQRSQRLRQNPAIRALFAVIRGDPDLAASLKTMLARRGEFRTQQVQTEKATGPRSPESYSLEPYSLEPFVSDIRRMTGLLAALGTDERLTDLVQLAMDRTAQRETNAFWKILREDTPSLPYLPEIVVGAGPHAANLCSTLVTLRPDSLPLVVEARPRTGGHSRSRRVRHGASTAERDPAGRTAAPDQAAIRRSTV